MSVLHDSASISGRLSGTDAKEREALAQALHLRIPDSSDAVSIILKLVGETCNLDCGYCYEKRRPYEGARMLAPAAVARLLAFLGPRPLSVELHGGEPLLVARDVLRDVLAVLRSHPADVELSIQTNATLLDCAWLSFFASNWPTIRLGISIDGDSVANNARSDFRGRSSHASVLRAVGLLREYGLEAGVIAVVTKASLTRPVEIVDFLAQLGIARVVKFVPCFDLGVTQAPGPIRSPRTLALFAASSAGRMPWAITPTEFTSFLIEAWTHWRRRQLYERFLLEPHTSVIRSLHGSSPRDCHFSDRKCAHVLTLYPDGRLGSCDELDRPSAFFGEVESVTAPLETVWRSSSLSGEVAAILRKCTGCSHESVCGGGCPASRLRLERLGMGDEYCAHRKALIDYLALELAFA